MIETDQAKIEFSSGLSSGAILPFTLRFFEKDDLQVWVTSGGVATLLSKDVDYSIADSSSYEHGANVTLNTVVPDGAVVTIKRVLPVKQGLSLPNHGKLPTKEVERELDYLTMVQQQQTEELARAFKIPLGGSMTVIPEPTEYAQFAEYAGYANAAGTAGHADVADALAGGVILDSATHATSAAGLDSGVVVSSATHATSAAGLDLGVVVSSAAHATSAAGLDSGVVVSSAAHATSAAALDAGVVVDSALDANHAATADYASNCGYAGMFAVNPTSSNGFGGFEVDIKGGVVISAGKLITVDDVEDFNVSEYEDVWLECSSGSCTFFAATNAEPHPYSGIYNVMIAENVSDFLRQRQYGAIIISMGESGGMQFPNYAALDANAMVQIMSSGALISITSSLAEGSQYYARDDGYLRVSIKNITGGGCLAVTIGSAYIGLMEAISGGPGVTFPDIPISKGTPFAVSFGGTGNLLVKFDHDVSITKLT